MASDSCCWTIMAVDCWISDIPWRGSTRSQGEVRRDGPLWRYAGPAVESLLPHFAALHAAAASSGLLAVQNIHQSLPHLGFRQRRRNVLELERLLQGEIEPPHFGELQR